MNEPVLRAGRIEECCQRHRLQALRGGAVGIAEELVVPYAGPDRGADVLGGVCVRLRVRVGRDACGVAVADDAVGADGPGIAKLDHWRVRRASERGKGKYVEYA